MITVTQNKNLYEIRSKYDPELVEILRGLPDRRWNAEQKIWEIQVKMLGRFLDAVQGTKFESQIRVFSDEAIGQDASLETTDKIPNIDLTGVPFYIKEGQKPFKHQLDALKYAIGKGNGGFLLCDDPGMGKTVEVLNIAMHRKSTHGYKHCLIICCINTAKYTWYDEISDHLDGIEKPYILGTRIKKRSGQLDFTTGNTERQEDLKTGHMYGDKSAPELPYFIITNIESIRAKAGRGKFPMVDILINWINNGKLDMIVLDEIHKNTSPTSQQGKCLLEVKKRTGTKAEWLPLTGTPITKAPLDAFLPLKLVDGHLYNSFYKWKDNFCVMGGYGDHQILSYKNIPDLKDMLQEHMIRRRRQDVFDLPPKTRIVEYVENTPYQQRLYNQINAEIKKKKDSIIGSIHPLVAFLKLRQVTGSPELVDDTLKVDKFYPKINAKLTRLLELLEEITARGEKVVVYSNWVEPLRTLYKFIAARYNTAVYTGTMKEQDRQAQKTKFVSDPKCHVLLGTVDSLGTSHTLTVAKNIVFYDTPWVGANFTQAEDRCYARGAVVNDLKVHILIAKDSVDEVVYRVLHRKLDTASFMVDNDLNIKKNPELFDMLLG